MTWTDILLGLLQVFGLILAVVAAAIFLLMLALVIVGSFRMWQEWREEKKNGLR